jgi:hypothetical protein
VTVAGVAETLPEEGERWTNPLPVEFHENELAPVLRLI